MNNLNSTKNNFIDSTYKFLESIKYSDNQYQFVKQGLTKHGSELKLGTACFGLKINYILGNLNNEATTLQASEYLNSFQKSIQGYPKNSFIDEAYLNYFRAANLKVALKHKAKELIAGAKFKPPYSKSDYLKKSIRAESKQAISTLIQIGGKNSKPYLEFPNTKDLIVEFLNLQNWNSPWDAGAQFSGICLFSSTQDILNRDELSTSLKDYISKIVNPRNGFYYSGSVKNQSQLVNGSMKVISGLEWLEAPIHYPEKLIDSTLKVKPNSEGCDLVDIVYVLYQCSLQTTYRKKDIRDYFIEVLNIIQLHQHSQGGFSYYLNKSQTHYYGVNVSKGFDEPDLHGTTLLIWAASMIFNFINTSDDTLKVLKT
jgi:hypothetical protein